VIWASWNEAFTPRILFHGFVVGSVALVVTNRFLIKSSYQDIYRIGVIQLLHYVAVLILEIFRSGYHAIYITVTDRINVGVVDLPTGITDPLVGTMVATAITLTPGTVTIEFEPGRYKVVWIDCTTTDPDEAAESIFGSFERVFTRNRSIGNKEAP
jgi:multicomponent Na+:H+ antiporter subunit E